MDIFLYSQYQLNDEKTYLNGMTTIRTIYAAI